MALKIVWTPRAEKAYEEIISYLEEHWTEREVRNFLHQSQIFFELLYRRPEILEKSDNHKNLYRGPMDKHNIITYRVRPRKKQIELLNIRSAKQKPLNK